MISEALKRFQKSASEREKVGGRFFRASPVGLFTALRLALRAAWWYARRGVQEYALTDVAVAKRHDWPGERQIRGVAFSQNGAP